MPMNIKDLSLEASGARGRLGRVCRGLGLALLLTLSLGLSGCAWLHIGSQASPAQPTSIITPTGVGDTERQQYLEDAGPAVRFVGAGALQVPTQP